jgi:hypothetical protein
MGRPLPANLKLSFVCSRQLDHLSKNSSKVTGHFMNDLGVYPHGSYRRNSMNGCSFYFVFGHYEVIGAVLSDEGR